jgi:hypothetical protein
MAAPQATAQEGQNCSYRLVPISRVGSVNTATTELIGCYNTFAEAIEAGIGGALDLPSSTTPLSLSASDLVTQSATSDTLIGTEFDSTGFGGGSTNYFAASTCSASNTWEVNYVGDALNDTFSSGKGFGGCDHNKKFVAADFAGNVVTCTPNCTNYGAGVSNEVSSLRWKP